MTRIGIAGRFGRQGIRWADTLNDLSQREGTALVREPGPAKFGHDKGMGWVTHDLAQFLFESDRVIIATPVETHYEIAAAALRAGKSVLCEKPLAPTFQQAAKLHDLAARSKTRLWTCYPHLWHPSVEAMAKRASVDLEVTFCGPTDREPLLDWGPHALSTALYILGTDATLEAKQLSHDRKRATLEIESDRGRAHATFGLSPIKRVSVQVKNQPRLYYNNENCHPTTMQRMLAAWLRSEDDPRGDPALTLGVHELLEEVIR